MGLCALLAAVADRHPTRIAFVDQASKPAWCGRPAIAWTYAAAREIVARLAEGLQQLRLPPRSPVGLCMAGMAEAHLAYLAIEQAGHVPCLLPVTWHEGRLLQAVEAAQVLAVLTQGVLGAERPAERLCRVAARYFPLRFIAAFGPHVPDGVLSLDQIVLDHRGDAASLGAGSVAGLVTFAVPGPAPAGRPGAAGPLPEPEGAPQAVLREAEALTAAAAAFLVPLRAEAGDRILSLLPPSDLKGLATGLAAALLAGAALECHPVFDAGALSSALDQPQPTHLVAPAWMEAGFARTTVPGRVRTLAYVHRAPCRLSTRLPGRPGVVDTVAFDEVALLCGRRDAQDVGLVLASPERAASAPERAASAPERTGLLQLRRDPDGRLSFRGPACATRMLRRSTTQDENHDGWSASRFRASLFAGVATAVTEI
ncbi:long-chain fatty acid--CoA ligase [Methylobacterium nonmethylotrophicum]|uniref:Long-chain fatty acid--CoA ligase n=2 Tax=Methylobacterium nonmethylotrophicum TaxID=1141884 RepID=A0A4Z0NKD5_9HYPH|nr:long-chain fatty acid--CoA ligase [Methylobacterium nonmethylotrophicum]